MINGRSICLKLRSSLYRVLLLGCNFCDSLLRLPPGPTSVTTLDFEIVNDNSAAIVYTLSLLKKVEVFVVIDFASFSWGAEVVVKFLKNVFSIDLYIVNWPQYMKWRGLSGKIILVNVNMQNIGNIKKNLEISKNQWKVCLTFLNDLVFRKIWRPQSFDFLDFENSCRCFGELKLNADIEI